MKETTRILTITERLIPSNIIGVVKPMLELQKLEAASFRMRYFFQYQEKDIRWADVIVLCRSIKPEALRVVELAQKHGKRLIYDIDDNFFELSVSTPLGRYHRHPVHLYVVTQLIKYANAVRVYSRPMEEICGALNCNTYRLKSYFDFSCIQGVVPQEHKRVRIVYATSRGKVDTLAQIFMPAVARVLARYPQEVEFYTFGQIPAQLKGFRNAYMLNYITSYDKYLKTFYAMNFDIGLAPLLDDRFHNSKTNNKFREYGAMEVCGIYSDAQIYRDCVKDEENGLLVQNTTEDWYAAMCRLVEDAQLRGRIQANAKECVLRDYSMESTLTDWQKLLTLEPGSQEVFRNILNLNIGVVWDAESPVVNYRQQSLFDLANFCGIHFELYDFATVNLKKLQSHDLCICFFSQENSVAMWLSELRVHQFRNVVADTLFPYTDVEKYPEVLFTNSEVQSENSCLIHDPYLLEETDLIHAASNVQAVINQVDTFGALYKRGIQRVQSERELQYSNENPMFEWAVVLGRYQGSMVFVTGGGSLMLVGKVFRFVLGPVIRPIYAIGKRVVSAMLKAARRSTERLGWLRSSVGDYVRINYLKKY